MKRISIDFAVMEHAPQVLVVELKCRWIDVGSWTAIAATRAADAAGNFTIAPRAVTLEAGNNIIVSEDNHLIAALGVEGLVIVHSADATLICRREDVEKI